MELDRRIIYLFVLLALLTPMLLGVVVKPARMRAAERFYQVIESLPADDQSIALVVLDFGPNSQAENEPQARAVIEHLLRRGVHFALFSQYPLAEPFLSSLPQEVANDLERETGKVFVYGRDWVNLGYRPGAGLLIQSIPKTEDLVKLFQNDQRGTALSDIPVFRQIHNFKQIKVLIQFTSLTGTFEAFQQFFQNEEYRPIFLHGCTSITIPKAYIYLDSGQLQGLLEGFSGAAWYADLLSQAYKTRPIDRTLVRSTGLGAAQLVIIFLIILGNITALCVKKRSVR